MNNFEIETDGFSARLMDSLADLLPSPGLETRLIGRLPKGRRLLWIAGTEHPMLHRAVGAVAATVVLGLIGSAFLPEHTRIRPGIAMNTDSFPQFVRQHAWASYDSLADNSSDRTDVPDASKRKSKDAENLPALMQPPAQTQVPVLSNGDLDQYKSPSPDMPARTPAAGIMVAKFFSSAASARGGSSGYRASGSEDAQSTPAQSKVVEQETLALSENSLAANVPPQHEPAPQSTPAPVAAAPVETPAPAPQPATPSAVPLDNRKIIRSGQMEFEVDNFDAAYARLSKIVTECGGFIGATDSERQPNGKVHGTVTVRLPPENLDTLVLKLRALGDLKQQQITAQDITREYTDLQSELRAAQAMQDRLMEIIRDGKGQVKDLLAVEKELGNWREKIEQVTGQINYYNNLVALSTLQITLSEKDIDQAIVATQTQTVNAALEADDVARARDEVFKAVDSAKGRIVQANLNEEEAGQYTATIVASIPPDAAGSVVDRLYQLGHVAHLDSTRQQTLSDQTVAPNLRIERRDTILNLSIAALAGIAPQETDELTLLPKDGDLQAAYSALLDFASKPANLAHVVDKDLQQENGQFTSAAIDVEVSRQTLDQFNGVVADTGKIVNRKSTRQPDSASVIDSKVLIKFSFVNVAALEPRQTFERNVACGDVTQVYQSLLDIAKAAGATVRSAQLNVQQGQNIGAEMEFDLPADKQSAMEDAIQHSGAVLSRSSTRAAENDATTDSKIRLHLSLSALDQVSPRRTYTLDIQTARPQEAAADIISAVLSAGGTVVEHSGSTDPNGQATADLVLQSPLSAADDIAARVVAKGTVHQDQSQEDPQSPAGPAARARLEVHFSSQAAVLGDDNGLAATVRQGLTTSIRGLLWSVELVVIGLCLVVPWLLIGWIAWRLWRRWRTV